jgi:uncharacterized protein (DUF58 family)
MPVLAALPVSEAQERLKVGPKAMSDATRVAIGVAGVLVVINFALAFLFGPLFVVTGVVLGTVILGTRFFFARNLRFSGAGAVWTFATVVLLIAGFVAMYRQNNLLIWLAYAAVTLVLLNGLAAGRGLERVRARRHVVQPIFAQTPFLVEVELFNPSPREVVAVNVVEKGSVHSQSNFCVRLETRGRRAFRHEITLPYRGTYFWAPLIVSSGYPFGLIERRVVVPPSQKTFVLPALGRLHRGRLRRFLRGADPRNVRIRQRPKVHRAAQDEFHRLRPYRPGDSLRWVHWRTSARRGELMVREFEDLPSENLLLIFDPTLILEEEKLSPAEQTSERRWLREQFEQAVSLVASVVWDWCRRPGNRLVFAYVGKNAMVLDGPTSLAHGYAVLEFLAHCRPNRVFGSPLREQVEMGVKTMTGHLRSKPMPAYSALIVTIEASAIVEPLQQALNRPVSWVDITALNSLDFYEAPKYIPWEE